MTDSPHRSRVLLVANRSCPCPALLDVVAERAGGGEVHIVAPALNSRLRHYVSDTDAAVVSARERLELASDRLALRVGRVSAEVGDADPLVAIADSLAVFAADELVVGTLPPGRSHWLEKGLVEKASKRFGLPVTHVASEYDLQPSAA